MSLRGLPDGGEQQDTARRVRNLPDAASQGGYNSGVPKQAGIYIHIPFCERKCTYCNFNTTDFDSALSESYVQAVAAEIAATGERLSQAGKKASADTIYFGGGTPSIITARQIETLVLACVDSFSLEPD